MIIRCTSATYSSEAHDDVLQQWQAGEHDAPLTLDLSAAGFIDPYGMAALVLFLNHLPDPAKPVRLLLRGWPAGPGEAAASGPVSYLTRMGFWPLVAPLLDTSAGAPPTGVKGADRSVLLALTVMRSHDAISVMLRQTGNILQGLNYSVPGRGHIMELLSELSSNVLLHAQTEYGAVAAMQIYTNRDGSRYVVMSIGDGGIGVRRSLSGNTALASRLDSDAQALGLAVQRGTSRFASGGHGGGLPRVVEIARRYNGLIAFRSGEGALAYNGSDEGRRIFEAAPLHGTQLRITLPAAGLTHAQGVLDAF